MARLLDSFQQTSRAKFIVDHLLALRNRTTLRFARRRFWHANGWDAPFCRLRHLCLRSGAAFMPFGWVSLVMACYNKYIILLEHL